MENPVRAAVAGLSHSHCNLGSEMHLAHGNRWIFNPLSEARDPTLILIDTSWVCFCWATMGTTPNQLYSHIAFEITGTCKSNSFLLTTLKWIYHNLFIDFAVDRWLDYFLLQTAFFFFFLFFRAPHVAYESSQTRSRIGAIASSLYHSSQQRQFA